MALARNLDGVYTWYPYMINLDDYEVYTHVADENYFYFIENGVLYQMDRYKNITISPLSNSNSRKVRKMVICEVGLVCIYPGCMRYRSTTGIITKINTGITWDNIELYELGENKRVLYELNGNWFTSTGILHPSNIRSHVWSSGRCLYFYTGHKLYRGEQNNPVRYVEYHHDVIYIGDYIVIAHMNNQVIIHPDNTYSRIDYQGNIDSIQSDDTSISITDSEHTYLFSRNRSGNQKSIGIFDCLYPTQVQVKSARNI